MEVPPLTRTYDVAVVGLGALGSLALRELARRGHRTVGFDRHHPPHTHGSSHGRTRVIRAAYFEHPLYVPLVREAWKGWHRLGEEADTSLFRRVGALMVGPGGGEVIRGTLASAQLHRIPHRIVAPRELRKEVPRLRIPHDHLAVWEEGAGVLFPERCVEAALQSARAQGAQVRPGVEVRGWTVDDEGVTLTTESGERVRTRFAVLAAGPWMPDLLRPLAASLARTLEVERQVTFWFDREELPALGPPGALVTGSAISHDPEALPIVLWEYAAGRYVYLIPDLGDGLKAALHHEGTVGSPDDLSREIGPEEESRVRRLLTRLAPGVVGRVREASVCFYTNTPDRHFLLGAHPDLPRVILLGGGSGHAFKFAPALGSRVADLVEGRPLGLPRRPSGSGKADPFTPIRLGK
jgi:sarcosine oxidase